MPGYQVDIEKSMGGEFWTNRYFIDRGNVNNAALAAMEIVSGERSFHRVGVTFTKLRVRSKVVGDEEFVTIPLNQPGLLATSGPFLPLFNVVRVDVAVVGGGRPSRKYYRIGLCAGDLEPGVGKITTLAASINGLVEAMMEAVSSGGGSILDPDNQVWDSAATFSDVAMRQLRRGSRRRTEPIL